MLYQVYIEYHEFYCEPPNYIPVQSVLEGLTIIDAHRGASNIAEMGIQERDPETDNDWSEWCDEDGFDCGCLTVIDGKIERIRLASKLLRSQGRSCDPK